MSDILNPPATLLVKLGSFVVHVQEADSASGHEFDWAAIRGLLADPELLDWLEAMDAMALLPEKR